MNTSYYENTQEKTYSMSGVFGWMFLAILLTGATAFGLPYLLAASDSLELYIGILIGGLVSVLVLTFVGRWIISTTKSAFVAILIFSLFSISMGVWISPLILFYEIEVVGTSLLVTAVIFGIMAIYGSVTKTDLSGFGSILFMILIGAILISIINIFIANTYIDWIISYVLLAVYVGFVAYDVQNVKKLAESGQLTTNVSLLMALNLYVDFIYIFIRLLAIINEARD